MFMDVSLLHVKQSRAAIFLRHPVGVREEAISLLSLYSFFCRREFQGFLKKKRITLPVAVTVPL